MRDFHFRLAEDDARLLFPRGLRFARHRVLERRRNHHVAHLDGLHGDTPRIRSLVDQRLEFGLNPLASAQQLDERCASDDVAQRCLRAPAHGLRVVLHLEGRLLRVVHHPEQDGIDIHRNGVRRQRLLGGKTRGDRALIDPRADDVDKRHDPEEAGTAHAAEAAEPQDDRPLPLPRDTRRLHGDHAERYADD